MHLMHVHLNINCVLFLNEYKVQNQYMNDKKETTQNFSSKHLKNH